MSKPRIAIVRGGPSDEYAVSLKTGSTMLEHIDRARYTPLDVVITKSGEWLLDGVARYPEHIVHGCDAVLIALHGSYGEDGVLQRLLERYGVSYTGSGPLASAMALNKHVTKEQMRRLGIKTPRSRRVSQDERNTLHTVSSEIRDTIGSQYVIKPLSSGSSLGIELVLDTTDLMSLLEKGLDQYAELLVEEYIDGREATCGVIERYRGKDMYVLPPIEIIPPPHASFFDYDSKYHVDTQEICPSNFSHSVKKEIEELSARIHRELNLSQYSRSDFMIQGNDIYFIEVNTLPGLTQESLFPKALTAVGSSYGEFLQHLIHDTLHGNKTRGRIFE